MFVGGGRVNPPGARGKPCFRRDANSVFSLVRGSMDNAGEVMASAADINRYAVDVLHRARAMQLSMRPTLRCLVGALVMSCVRQGVR